MGSRERDRDLELLIPVTAATDGVASKSSSTSPSSSSSHHHSGREVLFFFSFVFSRIIAIVFWSAFGLIISKPVSKLEIRGLVFNDFP